MIRLVKTLLALGIVVLCAAIASAVWPPAGGFLLAAIGRAPDCGMYAGGKATYRRYLSEGAGARLLGASHFNRGEKGGYMLTDTPKGRFWEPVDSGSEVVAQLAEIEAKYAAGAPAPVRPGDVVLDCGANVGVFSREALNRGARLVVAVEPVPRNLECIRRNLRAEIESGRVIVYPKGVWDKDDLLQVHESDRDSAEDSFVRGAESHPGPVLPLTTIDKLAAELKLDRVDFIKMDIEGAEPKALAGARETLRRFRPRLEVEVSGNAREVAEIARRAWPGYRSECLMCILDSGKKSISPVLIDLLP